MKNISIKCGLGLALLALIFSMSSCKKSFLDVNDDPNSVNENNITPELIFPAAAVGMGSRASSRNFDFLSNWMGYFCQSGTYSLDGAETSYRLDFQSQQGLWQNHNNVIFDLETTRKKSLAKGDSVLAGLAIILKVKLVQEMVDLWGNIPYSQAFNIANYSQPKYDKAEDIYIDLFKQLDIAIGYLKGTPTANFPVTVGNIIKFGATGAGTSQANWTKVANTLKLRLLIRSSGNSTATNLPGIIPTDICSKITSDGGVLTSGLSLNVNPGFANDVNKQSFFFGNYSLTPTGTDANDISRANRYATTLMGNDGVADPRVIRLYKTIGGVVVPCTYGSSANLNGGLTSKVGPGTAISPTQNQWILTSVESLFLYAEAVTRGWFISATDKNAAYKDAVKESFIWLGVPTGTVAADAYILANPSIADYTTVAANTETVRAKFIAYQKYLAMNSIDPLEAYSDYRRLDMLSNKGFISVNGNRLPNLTDKVLPNRVLYPQEEYSLNPSNVLAQGDINTTNIFGPGGKKIFWMP